MYPLCSLTQGNGKGLPFIRPESLYTCVSTCKAYPSAVHHVPISLVCESVNLQIYLRKQQLQYIVLKSKRLARVNKAAEYTYNYMCYN